MPDQTPQQMDIQRILQLLWPHRYPFLLVDRVVECVPGSHIRATKRKNESFFRGIFPARPMPGVLILRQRWRRTGSRRPVLFWEAHFAARCCPATRIWNAPTCACVLTPAPWWTASWPPKPGLRPRWATGRSGRGRHAAPACHLFRPGYARRAAWARKFTPFIPAQHYFRRSGGGSGLPY